MNHQNSIVDALSQEGVLINVTVRYWRATKKLKPQDLGLNPDSVTDRLILLGHKKLLPKEALQAFSLIEGRAHGIVESNTFPFLGGLGHYLPNAKLVEITEKLEQLKQEFQDATAAFVTNYGRLRTEARAEWETAAAQLSSTPEQLLATIETAFPGIEALERRFGFETRLFQVRAPEAMQTQIVTRTEQLQVIEARRTAASHASETMKQELDQFLSDCVASLRQQTADLCSEMLTSIRESKTGVHQKTLNRLVRFIDQFKQLNFVGDRQMEEQLDQVRSEFLSQTAQDYRENRFAKEQLEQGLTQLRETASRLASETTAEVAARFGAMGQRRIRFAS